METEIADRAIYAEGGRQRDRLAGAIGAAALTGLIVFGLTQGGAVARSWSDQSPLRMFDLAAPAPEEVAPRVAARAPAAAAPPHRRAKAVSIVAPAPIIVTAAATIAAPVAGVGFAAEAGAADAGSGAGAEGAGEGSGAGGAGDGGGLSAPPRRIAGGIDDRDYPKAARKAGLVGTVTITLAVDRRGRVAGCTVARSSGVALLDETTCRLAQARFRYEPARDAGGMAVSSQAGWRQAWWFDPPRK